MALSLVSASYDKAAYTVTLEFDRAIDVSALDGSVIFVDDAAEHDERYAATGAAVLVDPSTVEVGLVMIGPAIEPDTHLTAEPGNGIVAVDDGGTWAGVVSLALPFP